MHKKGLLAGGILLALVLLFLIVLLPGGVDDGQLPAEEITPAADGAVAEDGSAAAADEAVAEDGSAAAADEAVAEDQSAAPDAFGSYTSRDDVALYLHIYGKLPKNFITKKEAQALGYSGGGLEDYAPGMCIGGDYFGNYEGLLPDGDYHECDIDTLGKSSRGAKRLVYDADGDIYYTEDHYESFIQLY